LLSRVEPPRIAENPQTESGRALIWRTFVASVRALLLGHRVRDADALHEQLSCHHAMIRRGHRASAPRGEPR
jgi:hypothetical protein